MSGGSGDGCGASSVLGDGGGEGPACEGLSLAAYVRGHAATTLAGAAAVALVWPLLRLTGMQGQLAGLLAIMAACAMCALGLINYFRARAWCREFMLVTEEPDRALALASEMRVPDGAEARIAYEALCALRAQAAREVGESRRREREHREYVETWVHEVKTPLAAVRLMVANAGEAAPAGLSAELDRVDALVEQALFFARSTCVEKDFRVRACDVGALVREAVKSRAPMLVGAHVAVDMEGLEGLTVYADAKWAVFILGQIVDNAVKYRAQDRASRIRFSGRREDEGRADERVVLEVRDNGCGVPVADVGRVWEKGFTGANGRMHAKSTGIGLYLVRELCSKMGLAVSLSSQEGQWTCVRLAFPTNRMHVLDE